MTYQIEKTTRFTRWLLNLRDLRARIAIMRRIERLGLGNPGDCQYIGEGVSELRIDVSGGYRVYFTRRQSRLILLLLGGDKSSQAGDILKAMALAKELE
ncbi:type II toxin-antitoxin system RelE/ParE family toxin [Pantoea sp. Cy-639]|uniref:type II toxin-antitoxin system RelE/ParE family toxin n=1 Tax=Pantoea sp. Cy-639 TaxID=2608360 RepID=UPI00141DAAB9|nr:type II toxin-antitoxin system RelE/ParE family toxin [Pantoea sp. Cy-639]